MNILGQRFHHLAQFLAVNDGILKRGAECLAKLFAKLFHLHRVLKRFHCSIYLLHLLGIFRQIGTVRFEQRLGFLHLGNKRRETLGPLVKLAARDFGFGSDFLKLPVKRLADKRRLHRANVGRFCHLKLCRRFAQPDDFLGGFFEILFQCRQPFFITLSAAKAVGKCWPLCLKVKNFLVEIFDMGAQAFNLFRGHFRTRDKPADAADHRAGHACNAPANHQAGERGERAGIVGNELDNLADILAKVFDAFLKRRVGHYLAQLGEARQQARRQVRARHLPRACRAA